jgi:hypothetical protein
VFPDHPRFFNPVSMTAEVQGALAETGQRVPDDPARLTGSCSTRSLPLRLGGADDRGADRRGGSRDPHRRGRVPERLPEPGHGRRVEPPRRGRPRGSDGHGQPPPAGRGLGPARLADRGPPPRGAGRAPAPVRAAGTARLERDGRALPRDRGAVR